MSYKNIHAKVCDELGHSDIAQEVESIFSQLTNSTQAFDNNLTKHLEKVRRILDDYDKAGSPILKL